MVSTAVFVRSGGSARTAPSVQGDLIFTVARAREGQHAISALRLCLHYNCDPKRISLFTRLLHFLLYRLGRDACWLASSCFGLLYRLLILLLQILELPCGGVQERDKKKSSNRDFTSILPFFSRYSRRSSFGLAPYHRLLQEVVIQAQISLNVIATVCKI